MAAEDRQLKKHLVELTTAVRTYLALLDKTMQQQAGTAERGRAIAKLSNALELENDRARYFGLGIDYRTDKR